MEGGEGLSEEAGLRSCSDSDAPRVQTGVAVRVHGAASFLYEKCERNTWKHPESGNVYCTLSIPVCPDGYHSVAR
ncbi:hypothetical protein MTO96_031136 [Rhipicephalus appendiculatus]